METDKLVPSTGLALVVLGRSLLPQLFHAPPPPRPSRQGFFLCQRNSLFTAWCFSNTEKQENHAEASSKCNHCYHVGLPGLRVIYLAS